MQYSIGGSLSLEAAVPGRCSPIAGEIIDTVGQGSVAG